MAGKSRRRKPRRSGRSQRGSRGDRYSAGELFLAALGAVLLLFFLGMLITSLV